jgi:hypothetical protein
MDLKFKLLPGEYSVIQLSPDSLIPEWFKGDDFMATVRTNDELSLVCRSHLVPNGIRKESGWLILKIDQELNFSLVGILSKITSVLAEAGDSVFVLSTFNTDYILVKKEQLEHSLIVLRVAGHIVN